MIRAFLIGLLVIASAALAHAHEVRPALLKLTQTADTEFDVLWKQPIISGKRLKLTPTFPEGCTQSPASMKIVAGSVLETSTLSCDLSAGSIEIAGLERTLTDVFLEINLQSGETQRALLKPDATSMDLGSHANNTVGEYLALGFEHILAGLDHIFFVIGLALLVSFRQIWGVATSFTLAHSLTLALAAFGFLNLPSRPVEIMIALSIVFLGVEILRKRRGESSFTVRHPYAISFVIGLLHGCGFAGALAEIGLPKGTELLALLTFNIGIELGQFAIIAAFVAMLMIIRKINVKAEKLTQLTATYLIASIAAYWVIDRTKDYWL